MSIKLNLILFVWSTLYFMKYVQSAPYEKFIDSRDQFETCAVLALSTIYVEPFNYTFQNPFMDPNVECVKKSLAESYSGHGFYPNNSAFIEPSVSTIGNTTFQRRSQQEKQTQEQTEFWNASYYYYEIPAFPDYNETTQRLNPPESLYLSSWCLYKHKTRKELYLTFRGSITGDDWMTDASFVPVKVSPYVYLHGTFKNMIESEIDRIIGIIEDTINTSDSEIIEPFTIYPTGHSLGAGLAQTFAILYANKYKDEEENDNDNKVVGRNQDLTQDEHHKQHEHHHKLRRNHKLAPEIWTFAAPLILFTFFDSQENATTLFNQSKDPIFKVNITNIANDLDVVTRLPSIMSSAPLLRFINYHEHLPSIFINFIKKEVPEMLSTVLSASLIKRFMAFDKTLLLQHNNEEDQLLQRGQFDIDFNSTQYLQIDPMHLFHWHSTMLYWKRLFGDEEIHGFRGPPYLGSYDAKIENSYTHPSKFSLSEIRKVERNLIMKGLISKRSIIRRKIRVIRLIKLKIIHWIVDLVGEIKNRIVKMFFK